jgi:hypothetical protein
MSAYGWKAPSSFLFNNEIFVFILNIVDVLKMHMISHSIFFFNTYFSLDLLHLLLLLPFLATLKPTYGASIAYGENL